MPFSDLQLMNLIKAHPIDDPSMQFSFSNRLTRKNGWNLGFVLKIPLHHGPTKGGDDEYKPYLRNYSLTLESYVCAFDCEADMAFWPGLEAKFDSVNVFKRVNTSDYRLIRKPWANNKVEGRTASGGSASANGCGGCNGGGGCSG